MRKVQQARAWAGFACLSLMLAGCHNQASVEAKDASAQTVANKVAASGIKPNPGRWEATMKFEQIDFSGVPANLRDAVRQSLGQTQTFAKCLTQAEADKPEAGFFQNGADDKACRYDNFSMAGGRLDATYTCSHDGSKETISMEGTYSADAYDVHTKMSGTADGKPMKMAVAMSAKRTGQCKGDEDS